MILFQDGDRRQSAKLVSTVSGANVDKTSGTLEITDHNGKVVGTYVGSAEGIEGLEPWRADERKDELSALATELQRRYVGYMQQKEYMSYLGFAVYLTAAVTILLLED